jgi:hypothetical protein
MQFALAYRATGYCECPLKGAGVTTAINIVRWSHRNQFPSALKLKLLSSDTSQVAVTGR